MTTTPPSSPTPSMQPGRPSTTPPTTPAATPAAPPSPEPQIDPEQQVDPVVAALHDAGVGRVHARGAEELAGAVRGFNLALEHRPAAVVAAGDAEEVAAAVRVADRFGLPVVPFGHGHGFASAIQGGVVVTTAEMAGVEVDPAARRATVRAGTTWGEVLGAAAEHGLAPLAGSAPHVGVIGYLLGGGISPVARAYGFAADHVAQLRVVTGTGEIVTASATEHPELFWALRGGKGGLGIVVEATIDLFPLTVIQAGGLFFDGADTATVLHGFLDWTQGLPEAVSASVAVLRLPDLPEIPEPLRGRGSVVHVRLAVLDEEAAAERIVAPLRALAPVLLDAFGPLPYAALGAIHLDPLEPMPTREAGRLLNHLDHAAVDALTQVVGPDAPVPLAMVELRLLGGALARPADPPNAVGGRDAAYGMLVVGAPVPELLEHAVPAAIGEVFAALEPWATGGVQANFHGTANAPDELRNAWSPQVRARLREVRAQYDPRGRFPFGGHAD